VPEQRRFRRLLAAILTAALVPGLALGLAVAPSGAQTRVATSDPSSGLYVVVLRDLPLASYDGSQRGYAATRPAPGVRYDAGRERVAAYRSWLLTRQGQVQAAIGGVDPVYQFTTAVSGFAAELTAAQVKQLRAMPEILSVEASTTQRLEGHRSTGGRAADELSDRARALAAAKPGRGVVIGVVDSGIWPENPSFAAIPMSGLAAQRRYPGSSFTCVAAERWSSDDCTAKIVSAKWFVDGFGADNLSRAEYLSARDGSGHGSHTAAIAAGNTGVSVRTNGQDFGAIQGTAPGAGLAIYKACWVAPDPDDDGCTTADTVMALDQAVSDGVDVLSYSIDDGSDVGRDLSGGAVQTAFLNAAAAGVFVATAAGDDGPAPASVSHQSPWVTTVAASQRAAYRGVVTLGNGRQLDGAMAASTPIPPTRFVSAADLAAPGFSLRQARLCFPGALDASRVDGAVVLCDRGVVARVAKSEAVARAGGAALVLANRAQTAVEADLHALPTLHVDRAAAAAIKRYLRTSGRPTAALRPASEDARVPTTVAAFSGRGPAALTDSAVLKPDLAANGVSVLAAVAPPSNFGRLWDLHSGTSMSTPVIAAASALVRQAHPAWSAAAVQSALMTTATPLPAPVGPLSQGAGEVAPRRALDPGLVYDVTLDDWLAWLGGRGVTYGDRPPAALTAEDLNSSAISLGSVVGTAQVTRTVTQVADEPETYVARFRGLRGVDARVTPNSFRLAPGETATFTVTFNARKLARYGRFAAGELVWRGSEGHRVRSPIVVRPEYVSAPTEVDASVTDGQVELRAVAGVTGTVRTRLSGMIGATPTALRVEPDAFDVAAPSSSGIEPTTYEVPAGSPAARFQIVGDSDVDLYVYRGEELVAAADSLSGDERVTLVDPPTGNYDVYAVAATTADEPVDADLTGWVLPVRGTIDGSIVDRSLQVTGGRPVDVTVTWDDLDASQRWFAFVEYAGTGQRTYLVVD